MSSPFTSLYQEELYVMPSARIAVLLSEPWENYTEEEKALLTKIIGSVRADLAAAKVITASTVSLADLARLQAEKVLAFGTVIQNVPSYQLHTAQGFSVIQADDLRALDDTKKKSLWVAMRSMFGI